jgi:hypothetical protein
MNRGINVGKIKLEAALRAGSGLLDCAVTPGMKLGKDYLIISALARRFMDGGSTNVNHETTYQELADSLNGPRDFVYGEPRGSLWDIRQISDNGRDEANIFLARLAMRLVRNMGERMVCYFEENGGMLAWLERLSRKGACLEHYDDFQHFGWKSKRAVVNDLRVLKKSWEKIIEVAWKNTPGQNVSAMFRIPGLAHKARR